jgi:hypothetical protein
VRGDEFLAALFFLIGVPLILGWLLRTWLNHKKFMKVLQLKAETNGKLLDRFGSDPVVLDFLKSDAADKLFEVKTAEATPRVPPPYTRMLTALQVSCMLVSVGLGLLYIRRYMADRDSDAFLFLGTMGVSLGIGALLAAASALVVAKMWRSLNNEI